MNNIITNFSEKTLDYLERATRGILYATFKTLENWGKKGAKSIEKDAEMTRRASVIKK